MEKHSTNNTLMSVTKQDALIAIATIIANVIDEDQIGEFSNLLLDFSEKCKDNKLLFKDTKRFPPNVAFDGNQVFVLRADDGRIWLENTENVLTDTENNPFWVSVDDVIAFLRE